MKAHLSYLLYVLRHKWYVFLECCRLGIPWLGIVHDMSKFSPQEWFPYVHSFYNPNGTPKKKQEFYEPTKISTEFDYAWLHHQRHNAHHWQSWPLVQNEDENKLLPVPDKYRREMLADWRGAGRAVGKPDAAAWYRKWWEKIKLHPDTRAWMETQLDMDRS